MTATNSVIIGNDKSSITKEFEVGDYCTPRELATMIEEREKTSLVTSMRFGYQNLINRPDENVSSEISGETVQVKFCKKCTPTFWVFEVLEKSSILTLSPEKPVAAPHSTTGPTLSTNWNRFSKKEKKEALLLLNKHLKHRHLDLVASVYYSTQLLFYSREHLQMRADASGKSVEDLLESTHSTDTGDTLRNIANTASTYATYLERQDYREMERIEEFVKLAPALLKSLEEDSPVYTRAKGALDHLLSFSE